MLKKVAKTALLAIMAVLLLASFAACSGGNDENGIYCTVTFDSDGGSSVKEQVVKYGEKAKKPSDPTKSGYTFIAWYYEDSVFDFDTEIISNMTLTAKWNPKSEASGGSGSGEGDSLVDYFFSYRDESYDDDFEVLIYAKEVSGTDKYQRIVQLYAYLGEGGDVPIPKGIMEIGEAAFKTCTGLESVVIPDSVTEIGGRAFYGCTGLTSVSIGKGVTKISYDAFEECRSLTGITIPDNVIEIGNAAFYNCRSLASVSIGKGVTKIGDEAFEDCKSLTSVTIPSNVTAVGYNAFNGCSKLESVDFEDKDGWHTRNDPGEVSDITVGDARENAINLKDKENDWGNKWLYKETE